MRLLLLLLFTLATSFASPPPGYTLVFDQSFPPAQLSIPGGTGWGPGGTTTWICHTPSASDFGSSYFSGPVDAGDGVSPFRIDQSGHLRIKAWFDSTKNHWRSGLLSTVGDQGAGFALANGYYECCMWIPKAGGTWPAFWLETLNTWTRSRTTNAVEIDVAELYGDQTFKDPAHTGFTSVCHQVVHEWTPTGGQPYSAGQATTVLDPATGVSVDFASGWHTFGCQISGSTIIFSIDGAQTFITPMPASGVNQPFYLMIDLAMGGGWPINDLPGVSANANPPGRNYPQELAIAWVRAYAPSSP